MSWVKRHLFAPTFPLRKLAFSPHIYPECRLKDYATNILVRARVKKRKFEKEITFCTLNNSKQGNITCMGWKTGTQKVDTSL